MTLLAKCSLRVNGVRHDPIDFTLPVTRVWFEGTRTDMHIQFEGMEEDNIRPHDNESECEEMTIPEGATLFIAWLKKTTGIEVDSNTTICSVIIEQGEVCELTPPAEALKDLVKHWVSPNRPTLYTAS